LVKFNSDLIFIKGSHLCFMFIWCSDLCILYFILNQNMK